VIRTAWVVFNLLVVTIPLATIVIVASLFGAHGRFFHYSITRFWSRWMLAVSGARVRIIGMEHVALDRPQIIVANHGSWFDVLALSAHLPKRFRFIAKKELRSVPFWGRAWHNSGHIAMDRSDTQSAVESLEQAARLVQADNSCIVIFPEGTRAPSDRMLPFKKGAFVLALHSGLDIVPAGLRGTREILPKGGWRVRPGTIIVRFGPPIPTREYGELGRDRLMQRVRTEIEQLSAATPH
jgi:1-acyl-sn-glycerol-3-phosphate acyltransferase